MRSNIVSALNRDPDHWTFLRQYPFWHRLLSRHPEYLQKFIDDYKTLRRKRWIDRVEDTTNMLQLMQTLMEEM